MSTQAQQLDDVLDRFLDAAMTGDDHHARAAYVDAQAFDLGAAGLDAHLWVARERAALTDPSTTTRRSTR